MNSCMLIDPLFQFHQLNPEGITKAIRIAEDFTELLNRLSFYCPNSREFSIAKTKLEEACFFAKKAMASDGTNQVGYIPEPRPPFNRSAGEAKSIGATASLSSSR